MARQLTASEIRSGSRLVAPRVSRALDEIVALLQLNLATAITARNEDDGLTTPDVVIRAPKSIGIAPADVMGDGWLNTVLVSAAVQTVVLGPRCFQNEMQIMVYSIEEKVSEATQVRNMFRRAECIYEVLYHFLTNHCDEAGRPVWQLLEPQGITMLPQPMSEYSGAVCAYRLRQTPDNR